MSALSCRQSEVREHYRKLAPIYGARANRTCEETYFRLVRRYLEGCRRVIELGSGSSSLLDRLGSPFRVACDFSLDMLCRRASEGRRHCAAAAGEQLPFRDAQFDGMFLVNVLEHVADLEAVLGECARVLVTDAVWLAITPNGNWEFWLDLAERWSLKLPEGPHVFLTPQRLRLCVGKWFEVLEHRTLLVLPVGPARLAALIDRVSFGATFGWGFFQYVVARRRPWPM